MAVCLSLRCNPHKWPTPCPALVHLRDVLCVDYLVVVSQCLICGASHDINK